jgi:hypothetical protein
MSAAWPEWREYPWEVTMRLQTLPLSLLLAIWLGGSPAPAATITVTTDLDVDAVDGACSLPEAIHAANDDGAYADCPAGAGADRIVFGLPAPAVIRATADLPTVTDTVAIQGPGTNDLSIDGDESYRLFLFDSPSGGEWFALQDLTVANGLSPGGLGGDGGGARVAPGETAAFTRVRFEDNSSGNGGGGLAIDSQLGEISTATVDDCTFEGNTALGPMGGGGLLVQDSSIVTVTGSAFVGNRTVGNGIGAGILSLRGFVTIRRSTVSGNLSDASGGGIGAFSATENMELVLSDVTVVENTADANADGTGDGGGLHTLANVGTAVQLTMENTIVAGNEDLGGISDHPDVSLSDLATDLVASGWNLIGSGEGAPVLFPAGSPNAGGDFVGTSASPIDPLLQALALNGGETLNHRPKLDAASPVIDHGSCPGRQSDQRGHGDPAAHLRIVDHATVANHAASDGCDIGAIERGTDPGAAADLFQDGFEVGHSLRWSWEQP